MAWTSESRGSSGGGGYHHDSGSSSSSSSSSQPSSGRRSTHGRGGRHGGVGVGGGPPSSQHQPPPQRSTMPPPSAAVAMARARAVQTQVDQLITVLEPCLKSEERRIAIFHHIRAIVEERFPCMDCHLMGSFPLKTYLPDSDLDLTICTRTRRRSRRQQQGKEPTSEKEEEEGRDDGLMDADDDLLVLVNEAICREAVRKRRPSMTRRVDEVMEIRSISFINARTPVVNCLVQNVSVDITINQTGSLATLTFLEEVDRAIGYDHLFKKSLLLLKAWCLHESQKYVGVPILGSKANNGGLTSYALSVMVLCLFTTFGANNKMRSPFEVFVRFLQVYSTFDWSKQILSLEGLIPIPKQGATLLPKPQRPPHSGNNNNNHKHHKGRFAGLIDRLREYCGDSVPGSSSSSGTTEPFPLRFCNIEDPLNPRNNLGYSLNRKSLQYLQHSINEGGRHLDYLLSTAPDCILPWPTSLLPVPQPPPPPPSPSNASTNNTSTPAPPPPLRRGQPPQAATASPASPIVSEDPRAPLPSSSSSPAPPPDPIHQLASGPITATGEWGPCYGSPTVCGPPTATLIPSNGWMAAGVPPSPYPCPPQGPPNALLGLSLVAAYFPRLMQLYHDPAVRRSDLLNHPCEPRTGMFVCDEVPLSAEGGQRRHYLVGDVSSFWYSLTSTVRAQEEEEEEEEEEDETVVLGGDDGRRSIAPSSSSSDCPTSPDSQPDDCGSGRECAHPLPIVDLASRHPGILLDHHRSLTKPSSSSLPGCTTHGASSYAGSTSTGPLTATTSSPASTTSPSSPCSVSSLSSQSPPPRPLSDDEGGRTGMSEEIVIKTAQRRLWSRHHQEQQRQQEEEKKGTVMKALEDVKQKNNQQDEACLHKAGEEERQDSPEAPASAAIATKQQQEAEQQQQQTAGVEGETTEHHATAEGGEKEAAPADGATEAQQEGVWVLSSSRKPSCTEETSESKATAMTLTSSNNSSHVQEKKAEEVAKPEEEEEEEEEEEGEREDEEQAPTTVVKTEEEAPSSTPAKPSSTTPAAAAATSTVAPSAAPPSSSGSSNTQRHRGNGKRGSQHHHNVQPTSRNRRNKGGKDSHHHVSSRHDQQPCKAVKEVAIQASLCEAAAAGGGAGSGAKQTPWTMAWLGLCLTVCCCIATTVVMSTGGGSGRMPGRLSGSANYSEEGSAAAAAAAAAAGRIVGDEEEKQHLVHWIREDSELCLGGGEGGQQQQDVTRRLSGNGTGLYQWLKDGVILAETPSVEPFAIKRAGLMDEGHYVLQQVSLEEEVARPLGSTWVRVARPPVLHLKPRCQMVVRLASMLALSVAADAAPAPHYQWKLNGVDLMGATSSTYIVPRVNASHMGTYTCEVWNMAGRVLWEEAVVAVGF